MKPLIHIMVIYDGIENPVFHNQVLAPFTARDKDISNTSRLLVTFEKKSNVEAKKKFAEICATYHIHGELLPRRRFLGKWSLYFSIRALRKILALHASYTLTARGPLAGYICAHALDRRMCASFTIQARGLLVQEYQYVHGHVQTYHRFFHALRTQHYKQLEQEVYGNLLVHDQQLYAITAIESVSDALTEYLKKTYNTLPEKIVPAVWDIPKAITIEQKKEWGAEMRRKLAIPEYAYIYCYNGSTQPWQCPEDTVRFFASIMEEQPESILLVITQDQTAFRTLLTAYGIPEQRYRLCSAHPTKIYTYLSAADCGLLFREEHIINWVSRPTKLLEYHAAGLSIIHNGTVGYIHEITMQQVAHVRTEHCHVPRQHGYPRRIGRLQQLNR